MTEPPDGPPGEPQDAPQPRRARSGELAGVLAELGRLRASVDALEAAQGDGGALGDRVDVLAAQLQALDEAVDALDQDRRAARPAPIWWPALDDDEWTKQRRALRGWLRDTLAVRYPREASKLAPCWERHHAAVDALTKAWLTWQAAEMNQAADARDAADWIVRWLPDLVALAARDLAQCRDRETHQDPPALDPDLLASFEPDRTGL